MKNILFICGRNRRRSPTAEDVFAGHPGIAVASAGTSPDADTPLTPELIAWADTIFVMEASQRRKLTQSFMKELKGKRLVCLNIPDKYDFMDPALVRLLQAKVPRQLR